ncbi:MAG: SgcJ/EcaC family oxidoreductase [Acidobacteria bacterium]|nr:SgcJ/EcaC family oxidoreductase [Acidobacteriota bacterium]
MSLPEEPAEIAEVVRAMEQAWSAGDTVAFAGQFAEDADLVNIYGMRLRGRQAIAGLYEMLFRSVFRSSRLECAVAGVRRLCDSVAVAHVRMTAHIPLGAMAGDHESMCSIVVQRRGTRWWIVALHNTLVSDGAERPMTM